MHVIAVNGSPRKKWNTATLLGHALDGAKSKGASTELVHLYDLDYKGCRSCFECKRLGGTNYGRCAVKDGLTPLLERVAAADAVICGTPVYFGAESGEMRSFMERLLFPYLTYTPGYASIAPRKLATAMVYAMNVSEQNIPAYRYEVMLDRLRGAMERTFGHCETLVVTDTLQFDDYGKFLSTVWDAEAKAKRRAEVFPKDCERAYELGARLAGG